MLHFILKPKVPQRANKVTIRPNAKGRRNIHIRKDSMSFDRPTFQKKFH